MDLDNTESWLPLDGLAPGFDANKAPSSTDLVGRELSGTFDDGARITHRFTDAETLQWEFPEETGPGNVGHDRYEAFAVDDGLYFVQFHHAHDPRTAVSLVVDLHAGRMLAIVTTIGDPSGPTPVVDQVFRVGTIDGISTSGPAIVPTRDLLGRRVMWQYSDNHAYEHIYLTDHWYTWRCLAGPEEGLADTDACTTYRVRPGIYLFAWREKVIPCASCTIADHRTMHSHGVLFGLDEQGLEPVHFTFGSVGRLLSVTRYPDKFELSADHPTTS